MERVLALVEGQTEEAFVGRCLRPHLWNHNVDLTATVLVTRRVVAGPDYKGGVSSWAKIARDLRPLIGDSGAVAVTTMLDYYAIPDDVPGMANRPSANPRDAARFVQAAMDSEIGSARLQSYLMVHEFEALLYSAPELCGNYLSESSLARAMTAALAECGEPEMVNDTPTGAPSKRIRAAYPPYQKTIHGPSIADDIGLPLIRSSCPHFDEWVTWLESLG